MIAHPWSRESQSGSRVGCEGVSLLPAAYLHKSDTSSYLQQPLRSIRICIMGQSNPILRYTHLTTLLIRHLLSRSLQLRPPTHLYKYQFQKEWEGAQIAYFYVRYLMGTLSLLINSLPLCIYVAPIVAQ